MKSSVINPLTLLTLLAALTIVLSCADEKTPTAPAVNLPDYRPPAVEWLAPSAEADLRGLVTLRLSVTDDSPLSRVAVYRNGVSPAEWIIDSVGLGGPTYEFLWNTLDFPDAYYTLEARVWDAAGNLGGSPVLNVHVANDTTSPPAEDTTPPDVWWTAPNPGTVRGEVELSFRILDDSPLQRVRVYQNGVLPEDGELAIREDGRYSLLWNTALDSDGVYAWEARAWDEFGNLGTSPSLLVRVANDTIADPGEDRTPPVISWLSPDPGDILEGQVDLRVSALDNDQVDSVRFYISGPTPMVYSVSEMREFFYEATWNTNNFSDGSYLLESRAWDRFGNVGFSEPLSVTVWNHRPRVIWVPDEFDTIQGAIDNSSDGDTIRVRAGTYYEGLRIMGKNIWLESEVGPERTTIDGTGRDTIAWATGLLVVGARTTATLRGFTVKAEEFGIRTEDQGSINVFNCITLDDSSTCYGINLYGSGGECKVYNCVSDGAAHGFDIGYVKAEIYNSVSMNCRIGYWKTSTFNHWVKHDWNLFWNNERDYAYDYPQPNDIFEDPLFHEGTYSPRPNSPVIDSGNPDLLDKDGSRSDIGIYGGLYSY